MPMTDATQLIAEMKATNAMTEAQLLGLRRAFGADMEIDGREADVIFELDQLASKPDGWADYFTLILTTYLVHQGQPAGYINDAMAAWLIARIDHDGVVETETELRLLMNVLKVAQKPGDRLEAYALKQVLEAVKSGRGYVGQNQLKAGVIGQAELQLLRQVFYGVGSAGGVGISKMEAQYIFALNEATKGRDNHPDWQKFFVGAISNHLMMISAPAPLPKKEVLRYEAWVESNEGVFSGFRDLTLTKVVDALKSVFNPEEEEEDLTGGFSILDTERFKHAERITENESDWLVAALKADGEIDANERALLNFIRAECPDINESLRPLLDAA